MGFVRSSCALRVLPRDLNHRGLAQAAAAKARITTAEARTIGARTGRPGTMVVAIQVAVRVAAAVAVLVHPSSLFGGLPDRSVADEIMDLRL